MPRISGACGGAAALQLGLSSLNLCQVFKVSKALPAAAKNGLLEIDVVERLPTGSADADWSAQRIGDVPIRS
jgi:hypothetical protein